jgi:hypothetical protein
MAPGTLAQGSWPIRGPHSPLQGASRSAVRSAVRARGGSGPHVKASVVFRAAQWAGLVAVVLTAGSMLAYPGGTAQDPST